MASSKRLLLPSLPSELIEEILYKTPAESLLRLKSTCKQWYALITDKKFIYNHFHHSPERFIRIDNNQTVQIMDPVTGILSVSPIPDMFRSPHLIFSMVHCDGLMLCVYTDSNYGRTGDSNLSIWNPVLRKIKWLEPSVSCGSTDFFGIGYDNTSLIRNNYKVLRFTGPVNFQGDDDECEIYDFKSDSWRRLDATFDWVLDTDCRGVSVKGNMYWIADKKEFFKKELFILSFDFSTETFKNICFCPSSWVTRLACFNGDRLSLLLQDEEEPRKIEVWMTNKLSDEVVSFTKYFNVSTSTVLPELLCHTDMARPGYSIGKHRDIRVWCEGLVEEEDDKWYTYITLYEIDEGGVRKQIETGRHEEYYDPFICCYVYVPSLIWVPELEVDI